MNDKFSKQAETYAKYRPGYPKELFNLILNHTQTREAALDCATGNGQTAKELANNFIKVFATDISQTQLDNAVKAENIFYSCQPAEHTTFEENTFDLITVSQALHWLDIENFYDEVKRVAKPGGVIAVWMYFPSFYFPGDRRIDQQKTLQGNIGKLLGLRKKIC